LVTSSLNLIGVKSSLLIITAYMTDSDGLATPIEFTWANHFGFTKVLDVTAPHVHRDVSRVPDSPQDHALDDTGGIVAFSYRIYTARPVDARVDGAVTTKALSPPQLASLGEGAGCVA
jgi:hypothetical protein